jgi:predicted RNase H-like HicB family nuclease
MMRWNAEARARKYLSFSFGRPMVKLKKGMHCNIETTLAPDGRWVSRMPAMPGWAAFGGTQEESLTLAQKVADIFMEDGALSGTIVLEPYAEQIPDHAQVAAPPPGSEPNPAMAAVGGEAVSLTRF